MENKKFNSRIEWILLLGIILFAHGLLFYFINSALIEEPRISQNDDSEIRNEDYYYRKYFSDKNLMPFRYDTMIVQKIWFKEFNSLDIREIHSSIKLDNIGDTTKYSYQILSSGEIELVE